VQERRWLLEGVERPDADALDVYRRNGGYGGARWRQAAGQDVCALVVDVTESEAGRFRDRKLAERLPHRLIEGALIAAHALAADELYLCIRADWRRARTVLGHALGEAEAAGWIGRPLGRSGHAVNFYVHPVPGPLPARGGDHLLPNLIECSRPEPRAAFGVDALPTLFGGSVLVHCAATLGYLPSILSHGADAFRVLGGKDFPGTVAVSVSGHVRRPGLFEIEIGTGTFGDVIDELAGGTVAGGESLAIFCDGAPALKGEAIWSAAVDPAAWSHPGGGPQMGSFGSGTIVVADESVAPIELAAKWLRDAAELSCGQCPGCREGSAWLAKQSRRLRQGGVAGVDLPAFEARLEELATSEADGLSICGHPTVAAQMTQGLLQIAPDELSQQAAPGAEPCTNDGPLRTVDSIHLRF